MNNEFTRPENPSSHPDHATYRRGICGVCQPTTGVAFWTNYTTMLLPLRRKDGQAVHEDVRTAAIRESLVGNLLP
jgi:hypothetical protein